MREWYRPRPCNQIEPPQSTGPDKSGVHGSFPHLSHHNRRPHLGSVARRAAQRARAAVERLAAAQAALWLGRSVASRDRRWLRCRFGERLPASIQPRCRSYPRLCARAGPSPIKAVASRLSCCCMQLVIEARRHGAAVLKIEPDLPDTPATRSLLQSYGFAPSSQTVQPPSTILLDISGAEPRSLGA